MSGWAAVAVLVVLTVTFGHYIFQPNGLLPNEINQVNDKHLMSIIWEQK